MEAPDPDSLALDIWCSAADIQGITFRGGVICAGMWQSEVSLKNCRVTGALGVTGLHGDHSQLTVTNCLIDGNSNNVVWAGGGVNLLDCQTYLARNTITGNSTICSGAGIGMRGGTLVAVENRITDNHVSGIYPGWSTGGGVGIDGIDDQGNLDPTTAEFRGNIISGNSTTGVAGGVGAVRESSAVSLIGNTITNNTAGGGGGGVGIWFGASGSITGNTIEGNQALSYPNWIGGGGILVYLGVSDIRGNAITQNSSNDYGGGISSILSTTSVVANDVSQNSVTPLPDQSPEGVLEGGGLYLQSGTNIIADNVVAHNSSYTAGGIQIQFESSDTLVNNTIVGNTGYAFGGYACAGIGVYQAAQPVISNNIVAFNGLGPGFWSDLEPTLSHNCFYGNGYDEPSTVNADPMFVDWANGDFNLMAGSPCIDMGLTSLLPVWVRSDFYDASRVVGAAVDIGAAEFQPPAFASIP